MKSIHTAFLLSALAVAGCSGLDAQTEGWLGTKTRQDALNEMNTVPVDGIQATLEKQAEDALDQGDNRRAAQFYEQLIGSEKVNKADKLRYKVAFADTLRRMGDNEKARTAFDAVLKETPADLDAQEGRGLTLMAMGKATDAGRVFADIMKKDGTRWRTLNALGILFVTKNMVPEAMAYYAEALKHSPDNPAILNNVGLSQAVDQNYSRAISALEQGSRLSGSGERRKQIDLNLALVYAVSGDVETAADIAEKYLQGPTLDNNLGLYAYLAKDEKLAKTYMNMALSGSSTFYERAWNNLDILEKRGAKGN